jgi:hypothetical protein
MTDWLLNLLDWKVHGPIGAAVVGLIYFGRKHVISDHQRFEQIKASVRVLEIDRVVRADIASLDAKLDRIAEQNVETLRMLAERRA